jgi:hypothetical protein
MWAPCGAPVPWASMVHGSMKNAMTRSRIAGAEVAADAGRASFAVASCAVEATAVRATEFGGSTRGVGKWQDQGQAVALAMSARKA